jgi:phosphonate metabolism protein (transferase hexapeptide repeat family)
MSVQDDRALHQTIDPTASIRDSYLGRWIAVGARSKLLETDLGDYSYVVHDSDIAYARIGRFTSIASHVRINPGNHPMERASQHHFTYRAQAYELGEDEADFFAWRRSHGVEIGHDVWIGHGAIILPGRKVGSGAVVGAGSIVTHDVPEYAIVAGNPARLIRHRFPEPITTRLLALRWWRWPHARLKAALPDFRSLPIDVFLDRHEAVDRNESFADPSSERGG